MASRFLIALAAILLFTAPLRAEQMFNKIAAVVNGEIVTLYDLKEMATPELKKAKLLGARFADDPRAKTILEKVLNNVVKEKLFLQDAERRGINVSDEEIDNEFRKMAQQRGITLEQAEAQIAKDGLTVDAVKDRVRVSIVRNRLLGMMVGRKVVITREEIERFYEKNKDLFAADAKVEVSLLIFAPDASTDNISAALSDGKISFEEAVQKYSVGPGKDQGGYLGKLGMKEISPQMLTAVEKLDDGSISNVLSLGTSKALIKLHSRTKGTLRPLEDVEREIEAKLRAPRLEASFKEYAKKLRKDAVVDVRL